MTASAREAHRGRWTHPGADGLHCHNNPSARASGTIRTAAINCAERGITGESLEQHLYHVSQSSQGGNKKALEEEEELVDS